MKTLIAVVIFSLPALAAEHALAVAAVKAACGPEDVQFSVQSSGIQQRAPQPEPGKALVYVVEQYDRAENEFLFRPTVRVGLDGSWVGANRSTSYLFFPIEPGDHHLCADWQSTPRWIGEKISLTSIRVESGQTYYVRARILEGGSHVYTLDLEQINPDQGRLLVATSPLSDYRQKK